MVSEGRSSLRAAGRVPGGRGRQGVAGVRGGGGGACPGEVSAATAFADLRLAFHPAITRPVEALVDVAGAEDGGQITRLRETNGLGDGEARMDSKAWEPGRRLQLPVSVRPAKPTADSTSRQASCVEGEKKGNTWLNRPMSDVRRKVQRASGCPRSCLEAAPAKARILLASASQCVAMLSLESRMAPRYLHVLTTGSGPEDLIIIAHSTLRTSSSFKPEL